MDLPAIDFATIEALVAACDRSDVERALAAAQPGIRDLAALLSPAAEPLLGELARRVATLTEQRFGRTIQIYAPLYIHNFCVNRCRYCGFSADNRIERRGLSPEEVEAEAAILAGRGIRHLLLVSGEAPAKLDASRLADIVRRLRPRFASISIEVQPLAEEEYRLLFAAGVTGVTIYQETYDRRLYDQVHVGGAKRDYDHRLATPARAAAAGMREVGIGALLGLADWRAEGVALGMHLAWLRKRFWRTAFTVSFPRLRPAAGEFAPLVAVSERNLAQLIFALRLFDADVGLVLSTREEARFRDGMIGLGPTRYSAGSCTAPGGYGRAAEAGEQFAIGDQRTVAEVCAAIRAKGFDPVRKDWDRTFQEFESAA